MLELKPTIPQYRSRDVTLGIAWFTLVALFATAHRKCCHSIFVKWASLIFITDMTQCVAVNKTTFTWHEREFGIVLIKASQGTVMFMSKMNLEMSGNFSHQVETKHSKCQKYSYQISKMVLGFTDHFRANLFLWSRNLKSNLTSSYKLLVPALQTFA